MNNRSGLSLLELLIFLGIFSVVLVALTTIFVALMRINVRQAGVAEVNRQSQVILQTVQYYVERSNLVDMTTDVATNTLRLRMPDTATDPTLIYLSSSTMYVQRGQSAVESLTTSRINVSNASFTRRRNPPGKDIVDVNFTVAYANPNAQNAFVQSLSTAVLRVSAASFDSDVVASTSNLYNLGVGSANWRSINSTIYFNGSNVGIGLQSPNSLLQLHGGDVYVDSVGSGIILRAPGGGCWRVSMTNSGGFATSSITCP